jgi:hypothetical protein
MSKTKNEQDKRTFEEIHFVQLKGLKLSTSFKNADKNESPSPGKTNILRTRTDTNIIKTYPPPSLQSLAQ